MDNALGARHGALDVVKHCAGCNHIRSKAAATSRTDVETRDDDDDARKDEEILDIVSSRRATRWRGNATLCLVRRERASEVRELVVCVCGNTIVRASVGGMEGGDAATTRTTKRKHRDGVNDDDDDGGGDYGGGAVNARVACGDADEAGASSTDDANTMVQVKLSTTPRRHAMVCFRAVLTEDIGFVDADIDRSDTWELPRTCDGCALYILPGCARYSCSKCDEFDLCAGCLRVLSASSGASASRDTKKKKKKKKTKRAIHEHGAEDFICAELADEEE